MYVAVAMVPVTRPMIVLLSAEIIYVLIVVFCQNIKSFNYRSLP